MAQAQPERIEEDQEMMMIQQKETMNMKNTTDDNGTCSASVPFRFNVQAPEFVPRSHSTLPAAAQVPISGYYYPCFHYLGGAATTGGGSTDWFFVGDQADQPLYVISNPNVSMPNSSKNLLTDDLRQKIVKQVEYQFSDIGLLANESLSKHVNKDIEGFVPISVIASTKKIKSLVSNNHLLAQALRSSSKLVVSNDGKKVRRKHPFTEKDREDLQSRTVVAENLPDDHSHQNLEKIFNVVGRVKSFRICHPQESNSSRSKGDFFVSNKLHALVEYENTETAERAVEKLNDERNWRKGLRVRLLLRCSPKSVLKNRKSEFDGILDDDDAESGEDSSHPNSHPELVGENTGEENSMGSKKGWAGRGRGKGRGGRSAQSHSGRGLLLAPSPQSSNAATQSESAAPSAAKQTSKGPRMPDGTRGFTMGRGKPLNSPALGNSP
ncbi:hypothetical protein Dsin_027002 [Dipteronia sinensis]|uniref:La-related protein 6C n=1 Tax=Dipteronia sinensis TaxID=43782 RepID=A0AAE0DYE5_9ROSI|nr:hypothetical protein Dsin_027002 [Dipteronia sinensis]